MERKSIQDKIISAHLAGKKVNVREVLSYNRRKRCYVLPEMIFAKALQKKLDTNDLSDIVIPMKIAKKIWRYLLRNGFYFEVAGNSVEISIDQYKLSTIAAVHIAEYLLETPTKTCLVSNKFFTFDGVSESTATVDRIFKTLYGIDEQYMKKRFKYDSVKCLCDIGYNNTLYCYIDKLVDPKLINKEVSEKITKRLDEIDRKEQERLKIIENKHKFLTAIQDEINEKKSEEERRKSVKERIVHELKHGFYVYDIDEFYYVKSCIPNNIHEWAAVLYARNLLANPKIYRKSKHTIKVCATHGFRERYEGSPNLSTWVVERLLRIVNRYFPDIIPVSPNIKIAKIGKNNIVTLEFYWEPYYG